MSLKTVTDAVLKIIQVHFMTLLYTIAQQGGTGNKVTVLPTDGADHDL